MEATYAAFSDLVVTVHDKVAEVDKVVARWIAIGIQAGPALRVTVPAFIPTNVQNGWIVSTGS